MEHDLYTDHDADRPAAICDSNDSVVLTLCRTCGGGEASLPTDCPGERMTAAQRDAVLARRLDYWGGAWLPLP